MCNVGVEGSHFLRLMSSACAVCCVQGRTEDHLEAQGERLACECLQWVEALTGGRVGCCKVPAMQCSSRAGARKLAPFLNTESSPWLGIAHGEHVSKSAENHSVLTPPDASSPSEPADTQRDINECAWPCLRRRARCSGAGWGGAQNILCGPLHGGHDHQGSAGKPKGKRGRAGWHRACTAISGCAVSSLTCVWFGSGWGEVLWSLRARCCIAVRALPVCPCTCVTCQSVCWLGVWEGGSVGLNRGCTAVLWPLNGVMPAAVCHVLLQTSDLLRVVCCCRCPTSCATCGCW